MVIGLLIKPHPILLERLYAACVALCGCIGQQPVAAENRNMPVTTADQIVNSAGCALPVVGRNTGQVLKRQIACVIRNNDGRNVDLVEIADKMTVCRAEEHHAHGLTLPAEFHSAQHLIVVFINKVNDQRMRCA